MASPQPDKFTKISNELLEEIPKYKFNGIQLRILLIVIRYTYGFNRKDADLSLTYLSNAIQTSKDCVKREVTLLISNKVLKVIKEANFNSSRTISLNKNYDEWLIVKSGQISLQGTNLPPVDENTYSQGTNLPPVEGGNLPPSTGDQFTPQEIHSFKDINKDNIKERKKPSDKIYFENPELQELFLAFIEFRKEIKYPMTDRAIVIALNVLNKKCKTDEQRIESINNSIMKGYRGLFPKEDKNTPKERQYADF